MYHISNAADSLSMGKKAKATEYFSVIEMNQHQYISYASCPRACNCKGVARDTAKLSLTTKLRKTNLACRKITFDNGNHTLTLCHLKCSLIILVSWLANKYMKRTGRRK